MTEISHSLELNSKITKSDISINELILYFREKCMHCGHQRIAHDEFGKCEGVMNKPCSSGCDVFNPE